MTQKTFQNPIWVAIVSGLESICSISQFSFCADFLKALWVWQNNRFGLSVWTRLYALSHSNSHLHTLNPIKTHTHTHKHKHTHKHTQRYAHTGRRTHAHTHTHTHTHTQTHRHKEPEMPQLHLKLHYCDGDFINKMEGFIHEERICTED